MRAKYEIERQLAHFKTDCATGDAEKEIWVKALEWTLGDAEHRAAYEKWLRAIELPDGICTPHELIVTLLMALERLR